MLSIGGNQFQNVSIPLVFEGRYFQYEEIDGKDTFTVFTIIDDKPIIEILRNVPQINTLSKVDVNASGILTVTDSQTNEFLYKIRPGSRGSLIFGKIMGKSEEISISDRQIIVRGNVFKNNIFNGCPIGIRVNKDGAISAGAHFPPELKNYIK